MSAPCNCDDSLELRAELAIVKRERDYLLQFADPKDIAQMRRELAAEWERKQGWANESDRSDFGKVLGE